MTFRFAHDNFFSFFFVKASFDILNDLSVQAS